MGVVWELYLRVRLKKIGENVMWTESWTDIWFVIKHLVNKKGKDYLSEYVLINLQTDKLIYNWGILIFFKISATTS